MRGDTSRQTLLLFVFVCCCCCCCCFFFFVLFLLISPYPLPFPPPFLLPIRVQTPLGLAQAESDEEVRAALLHALEHPNAPDHPFPASAAHAAVLVSSPLARSQKDFVTTSNRDGVRGGPGGEGGSGRAGAPSKDGGLGGLTLQFGAIDGGGMTLTLAADEATVTATSTVVDGGDGGGDEGDGAEKIELEIPEGLNVVSQSDLRFVGELGAGGFGTVSLAVLNRTQVRVRVGVLQWCDSVPWCDAGALEQACAALYPTLLVILTLCGKQVAVKTFPKFESWNDVEEFIRETSALVCGGGGGGCGCGCENPIWL